MKKERTYTLPFHLCCNTHTLVIFPEKLLRVTCFASLLHVCVGQVSSQERQPSSSRPKSAPTVGKTASGKQGLSLSQQDTPTSPTTEKVRSELHVPLEEDVGMNFDSVNLSCFS